ncbi:MAG: SpoIIE family protein phosphatase [bacterium]|jgi:PAS domain S-box-containing protein
MDTHNPAADSARESSRTMRIDLTPDILPDKIGSKFSTASRRPTIRITKAKADTSLVGDSDFQQLLQNVYDGAVITDYQGRIVDVNVRLCQFVGYEHHDLCRMELFDLLYGADETILPMIRENLASTRFVLLQAFFVRKDGSVFPAETAINRLFLSGQDYLCFFVRDITLRRQADEQLRTEHTAIQLAGSGIAIADLQSKLTYGNPAALRMWGVANQEEAQTLSLSQLFSNPLLGKTIMEMVSTGQAWCQEVQAQRLDGSLFYVQAAAAANFNTDDEFTGIVLSFNDVTERRLAEAQREQYAEQLRIRNTEMEADLDMAREIQLALLPRQFPTFPASSAPEQSLLKFNHFYRPSTTLGGDFFYILPISNHQAGVFACDVMGHGMRAALITAIMRSMVEELRPIASNPGVFMSHINREFMTIMKDAEEFMFVSASYVFFDLDTRRLAFSDAGHPNPLLINRLKKTVSPLRDRPEPLGPALGIMDKHTYPTIERPLHTGDGVLIYTDGITEAEGKGREQYGEERLLASARKHLTASPDTLLASMAADSEAFTTGVGFDDDVCMVVAEVFGFPGG